ncbi:hypothetical protein VTJ49DRAFT_3194 [Mycothermus thermophilus]|uniref:GMPS ATP-PPase domain-containing protein n=1 Tax=Humicola insolens TaxID=85995 RepID=A0ABR3VME2_HUMIN
MQELAYCLNPENVIAGTHREYGHAMLKARSIDDHVDRLFEGIEDSMRVWMSHGDKLAKLPDGFHTIASSDNSEYAAIGHATKPIYGLQFHPEVTHTQNGTALLKNFAVGICGCKQEWTMQKFLEEAISQIRHTVGDKGQVLAAVSGGVDSTVAAKLMVKLHPPDRQTCPRLTPPAERGHWRQILGGPCQQCVVPGAWRKLGQTRADGNQPDGVMRLNECEQVKKDLSEALGINLTVVDASQQFLEGLKGVTDPEKKRKFIGGKFIDVFEEEAVKIEKAAENDPAKAGKIEFFMQGTLYPDVIESLSFKGPSATIKTHHNVGGLPARMMNGQGLKLIEPLRSLYKDEVRELGRALGIREELVMRHPFPGRMPANSSTPLHVSWMLTIYQPELLFGSLAR